MRKPLHAAATAARAKFRFAVTIGLLLAVASFAAAQEPRAPRLVLTNGVQCTPTSPDLDFVLAGERVGYFCEEGAALLSDLRLDGDQGSVTRVEYDPFGGATATGQEHITFEVSSVTLDDGDQCFNAGHGATVAFGGDRVNFTCGGDLALLGDFVWAGSAVNVRAGLVVHDGDEFVLEDERTVNVTVLNASSPIVGHEWTLVSFGLDGEPAHPDEPATLLISEGSAYGTAGCNRYFASVEFGGDASVSFGDAGSTMMFCDGRMEQEQAFLQTLAGVSAYSFTADGGLLLSGAEGDLLFE